MRACQRQREQCRDRSDAATDLEHTAHAETLDLAERVERDLRELLDEAGEGSGDERSCSRRDLSVNEYEREKRVVDELMNLCWCDPSPRVSQRHAASHRAIEHTHLSACPPRTSRPRLRARPSG